jgi:anaerobic dimethyl sulfoxide reductase subunit C (anchor subunit)
MKERSLLAFTLLSQMAVGAFWVTYVLRIWATGRAGMVQADMLTGGALYMSVGVMVLALLASLLHLGAPARAWRAVGNLQSSWLSREVLLGLMFAFAIAVYVTLQKFAVGSAALRGIVQWLAGTVGLIFVFAMGNVYRLRTVPAWNRWTTFVSFFTTAFLLGGLGVGAIVTVDPDAQGGLTPHALSWIAIGAIGLLLVELSIAFAASPRPGASRPPILNARSVSTAKHGAIHRRRLVLIGLSAVVTGSLLLLMEKGAWTQFAVILALGLAMAEEVAGRQLFYLSKDWGA